MTATVHTIRLVGSRPGLFSRTLVLVLLADFAGLSSFYLLLPVVPQYATAARMGAAGAGLATAVLMASTVVAELAMPRVVAIFGHRTVLAGGLVLLGGPVLVLPFAANPSGIVAVCMLRDVGLAVIFVVCGELAASLVPADRRGEGLGVLGVVAGVPAVLAMPLGVWLAGQVGFGPVLLAGAVTALAGLAAVGVLPRQLVPAGQPGDRPTPVGVLTALRTPGVLRPSLVFAATTVGAGVVLTFLPVAVPHGSGRLAAVALLAHCGAATLSRYWAGRYLDRHGPGALLAPAALVAAVGMLVLVLIDNPVAVVAGAAVFGVGFGAAQSGSLLAMYQAVNLGAFGAVTALWSVAYDAGLGLGAAGFGLLAPHTGYPAAFALTAIAIAAAVPLCRRRPTPVPSHLRVSDAVHGTFPMPHQIPNGRN